MNEILAEQLVYGSFPFWDRGYDLLGRSPGCTPELAAAVVAACRRVGQPPSAEAAKPGLFALPVLGRWWAVVGVVPLGADDRGRPGALAFHALIVPKRDYERLGADPFRLAAGLRAHWPESTPAELPVARIAVDPPTAPGPADDPRADRVARALGRRRRVALEAAGPIDGLARAAWARLPMRARRRATVATWAFAGENRFDLVAFPRLAGVALDASYLPPGALDAPEPDPRSRPAPRDLRAPGSTAVAAVGLAAVGGLALLWANSRRPAAIPAVDAPTPAASAEAEPGAPESPPFAPAEAAQARAGLSALASRFEDFDLGPAADPAAFLARLADALHYHGPTLAPADLDQLRRDPNPDAAAALGLHESIARFRDDRPWPARFADLPLPAQLAATGRSFHLDPATRPEAVPAALVAALARPGLVRPSPLAARYPALRDYARFLTRLPRADDPGP